MQLKGKLVEIDFSQAKTLSEMHEKIKDTFEFPGFYGANVPALIDCWTDLRHSGEGYDSMCNIYIEPEETLYLKLTNLSYLSDAILNNLIAAIEAVNQRFADKFDVPTICLVLV